MSPSEDEKTGTWHQVRAILDRALSIESPDRRAFINAECDDTEIKRQVISMLEAYESATDPTPLPAARKIMAALPIVLGPGSRVGPYILDKALGAGGMGAVFLAKRADRAYEKQVAIKLIKRQRASEREIGRFRSERQILANLAHPSIAQLLDGGETEAGQPYLVMEYVEGRSITSYCRDNALTLDQRLDLFMQVCSAVQFAHQNLIVHRDLKPGNILVSHEGKVKLLDFGIAKILDAENFALTVLETQPGGSPMTLAYASPEQVRGHNITTATDVYALGILLYELLTGRRPHEFDGRNLPAAVQAICSLEAAAPSEQLRSAERSSSVTTEEESPTTTVPLVPWKHIQGDLDAIVLKALAKEPRHRYASAEQMGEDLQRFRSHQPVRARRDTLVYRSRKFLVRNRLLLAATTMVLLVLLASIVLLAQNRQELLRQKNQAETVSSWMTELFELPTPDRSLGERVTARELLEKSAATIQTDLANEPQVQARMLETLARSYISLGLIEEGLELARTGKRLTAQQLEPEDTAVFFYLASISLLLLDENQEAYEHINSAIGRIDLDAEENLYAKAKYFSQKGAVELAFFRLSDAESSYRLAETAARELGDKEVLATVLENFGVLKGAQQLPLAAERKYREALLLREALFDPIHPGITSLRWKLLHQVAAENREYASREADRLLKRAQKTLGDGEFHLSREYNSWAEIKTKVGSYDEARFGYQEATRIADRHLGPDNEFSLPFRGDLAIMELRLGNIDEARAILVPLMDAIITKRGRDSVLFATTLHAYGRTIMREGRAAEAEPYLVESEEILEAQIGPEHELTVTVTANVGLMWLKRKDLAQAATWFERAADRGRRAQERPVGMTTLLQNLGKTYRLQKRWSAAGNIYSEIVQIEGTNTVAGLQALTWVAQCSIETGQWQKALDSAVNAIEKWSLWEHEQEHKHWRVVSQRIRAHALVELGRYQEALEILQGVLDYRLRMGATEERFAKIRGLIARAEAGLAQESAAAREKPISAGSDHE